MVQSPTVSSPWSPSRVGKILVPFAWAWVALVAAVTFWRVWDIPARLPEINEIATTHLFLVPVSFVLFFALSWVRHAFDVKDAESRPFPRWAATIGIWALALLHPVSCALYPASFNLDTRTVDAISKAVSAVPVGLPRAAVEKRIVDLNASLPISMQSDAGEQRRHQEAVARYFAEASPAARSEIWRSVSKSPLVFIPWGVESGGEPDRGARDQAFIRRLRPSSDIGVDRIRVRYGPRDTVEEIVYTSNRQLTMEREPCTVHMMVPAAPETSFPFPCPAGEGPKRAPAPPRQENPPARSSSPP